jgi:hypothetical protein
MITIYSIQYNKPKFIELQKASFDKFIDNYQYIVIDNSVDNDISNQIDSICNNHKISLIKTINKFDSRYNGLHGFAHEIGIKAFLNELKQKHTKDDLVMLVDHDLFFISYFSKIIDLVKESSILTIKQERNHIYYVWPGLVIFNLKNCVNIEEISLDGAKLINGVWIPIDNGVFTDVGGHSYHYLKKYKDDLKLIDISELMISNIEQINENHMFYHFHDGSQWSGYSNEIWENKFNKIQKILL